MAKGWCQVGDGLGGGGGGKGHSVGGTGKREVVHEPNRWLSLVREYRREDLEIGGGTEGRRR